MKKTILTIFLLALMAAMPVFADCNASITPTSSLYNDEAHTDTINVSATTGCSWLTSSNATWATITFGNQGQGDGTVYYSITENTSSQQRVGTLTIAGQTFTITQDGSCDISISSTSASHSSESETGTVTVDAPLGCPWTASSNVTWANITSGGNSQGTGNVNYVVMANTAKKGRSGTLTIAGRVFTINQDGQGTVGPVINFNMSPSSGYAPLTVNLNASASDSDGYIVEYAYQSTASVEQVATGQMAILTFTQVGTHTVTLTVTDNDDVSVSQTKTVTILPATTKLINISTRAPIEGGIGDVIAGFIITGTGVQNIFIRGRNLEAGVDPYLKLQKYPSNDTLGSNNDWQEDPYWQDIPYELTAPLSTTDTGLLRNLPVGAYTANLSSIGKQGIAIIELNLAEGGDSTAKLINISTRAPIRGGAYDVIAGFIITGNGQQKVFIRARSLEAGVDPFVKLEQYPSGDFIASNDNWQTDSRWAEIPSELTAPMSATDAGFLKELSAGAYTVTLSSVGSKGLGIIEVQAIEE